MRELNPHIELQHLLAQQIFNALQGGVTEDIRQKCEGNANDVYFRSAREGNSLKVNETLLPQFYNLCKEVKEKLEFVGDIDFYITGDSEVNACAFYSPDEERPHIIEVNSGLFELMNEEELKYIIGYEIGHLINGDSMIKRLFFFIYSDDEAIEECPEFLKKRVAFFDQLAELSADFHGYMANDNLAACVTAVYKMASGLDLEKMNVSMDTLIAENNQRLEYFLKNGGVNDGTLTISGKRCNSCICTGTLCSVSRNKDQSLRHSLTGIYSLLGPCSTYNGTDCPQGSYIYVVRYATERNPRSMLSRKGTVLLLR